MAAAGSGESNMIRREQNVHVGAAESSGSGRLVESSRISWDQQDQGWSRVRREQQKNQGRGTSSIKYADKKEKKSFLVYKEIQKGSGAKSYMRKGFRYFRKCTNI